MKPLLKSYGHLQLNLEWDMLLLMMVPFTWLLGEPHLLPGIFVKLDVTFRYSPNSFPTNFVSGVISSDLSVFSSKNIESLVFQC